MTEQNLEQRVVELGRKLHAEGFIVTLDFCVQPPAIVRLMRRSEKRIRNLRCDLKGPPAFSVGRGVWYRLDDYLRWCDSRSMKNGTSTPSL